MQQEEMQINTTCIKTQQLPKIFKGKILGKGIKEIFRTSFFNNIINTMDFEFWCNEKKSCSGQQHYFQRVTTLFELLNITLKFLTF